MYYLEFIFVNDLKWQLDVTFYRDYHLYQHFIE